MARAKAAVTDRQRHHRVPGPVPLGAFLALLLGGAALAQTTEPDAARGATVAKRWCASCHQVDEMIAERLQPAVPSFKELAERDNVTADLLVGAITFPHPVMPDLGLSRRDATDLAAYIMTLRP